GERAKENFLGVRVVREHRAGLKPRTRRIRAGAVPDQRADLGIETARLGSGRWAKIKTLERRHAAGQVDLEHFEVGRTRPDGGRDVAPGSVCRARPETRESQGGCRTGSLEKCPPAPGRHTSPSSDRSARITRRHSRGGDCFRKVTLHQNTKSCQYGNRIIIYFSHTDSVKRLT